MVVFFFEFLRVQILLNESPNWLAVKYKQVFIEINLASNVHKNFVDSLPFSSQYLILLSFFDLELADQFIHVVIVTKIHLIDELVSVKAPLLQIL
jgi:hypothetical protein